jgi:hypothetical protein
MGRTAKSRGFAALRLLNSRRKAHFLPAHCTAFL